MRPGRLRVELDASFGHHDLNLNTNLSRCISVPQAQRPQVAVVYLIGPNFVEQATKASAMSIWGVGQDKCGFNIGIANKSTGTQSRNQLQKHNHNLILHHILNVILF